LACVDRRLGLVCDRGRRGRLASCYKRTRKDGLLAIELVREIPEAMKPRKIDIGGADRSAIGGNKPASKQTVDAEAETA